MSLNQLSNNQFISQKPMNYAHKAKFSGQYSSYTSNNSFFDEFSQSDTETAKSTGAILALGLLARNILQKITNNMFTNYFSKHQNINEEQVKNLGLKILEDKGLMKNPTEIITPQGSVYTDKLKKLKLIIDKTGQDAHFDYVNKAIKVTKNTLISLPHEIGHAVQEHNTSILKKLQRFRGNYAFLALLLYGLGRNKSTDTKENKSLLGKFQDTLHKYNLLIPLLAFSPELITEFAASKIGLDAMKKANAPKQLINAARKHYAVAFCTYLALPLFAVIDNFILRKASKN